MGWRFGKISTMGFAVVLAFLPAVALGVTVETLPQSEYADTEVSTNIPFEVSFDTMSRVNFSISLEASPSNSVEVSIGEDANGDGNLSPEEAAYTFGFDCVGGFQAFPVYRQLEPQETFAFTNFYKAVAQSGSANDIVVTGTFIENDTDESFDDEDKATAIKVEIKPVLNAPENDSAYRHKFGVGELVQGKYSPATAGVSWHSKGQGAFSVAGSDARYRCPLSAESNGIEIRGGGAEYTPVTSVVEPVSVMAQNIGYRVEGVQSGQAGGVLLTMTLHAMPMDVSFLGVKMEEVPDAEASKDGYFEDSYFMREWYHGRDQYAGIWRTVTEDNQFLADDAGFNTSLPQLDERGFVSPTGTNGWVSGYLTWDVPCGWAAPSVEEDDEPIGTFATRQQQVMTIDSSGNCEIRKHSQSVRRLASGQIYLNGELK